MGDLPCFCLVYLIAFTIRARVSLSIGNTPESLRFCRDFPKFFIWGDDTCHLYPETISAFFCYLAQERDCGGCSGHLSSPSLVGYRYIGHLPCVTWLDQCREGCNPNIACDAPNHERHQSEHAVSRGEFQLCPASWCCQHANS